MRTRNILLIATLASMIGVPVFGATFVVPPDAELLHRAHAVAIVTALPSYTQLNEDGGIETVTPMTIDEAIKGRLGDTIKVIEPGGEYGGVLTLIPGVPRFSVGEKMLLLLAHTGKDRWAVTDLVLGKFTFAAGDRGEQLLLRDAEEIVGWDPDLKVHVEQQRSAEKFLAFVRNEVKGGAAPTDYFLENTVPVATPVRKSGQRSATALVAPFTATSYTFLISGSLGGRWNVFPSAVNFFSGASGEPGAPGGGVTAVQTAISSWDNDAASNVNYVYAGTDSTHTQGLHAADGANTVLFERDLSAWGVGPFSCSSNSYSGTLGIGGITSASGQHSLGTETFSTTREADVEMNRGLANCSLLFGNGDFNSAVTHEVGHTLGFRHSDQNRSMNAACSTDASLECSPSAIMTAFVTRNLNGALQTWDQHAVQAVYPGVSTPPPPPPPPPPLCTPPSIGTQPVFQSVISPGQSVTLSVSASGTAPLTYQWYTFDPGQTINPVGGNSSTLTVTPSSTTAYWVRVANACGSADSGSAIVTVVVGKAIRGDMTGDQRPDIMWHHEPSGAHQLWQMSGTTRTAVISMPTIPDTAWHLETVADMDGDGFNDLIFRNYSSGRNIIWLFHNTSYIVSVPLQSVDLNWHIVGAADFNGDGMNDLVWRNFQTGADVVWFMNRTQFAFDSSLPSQDVSWRIEGTGDMTGDGKPDIVWHNHQSGLIRIWQMNGLSFVTQFDVGTIPDLSWHIGGLEDLNGDGKLDILLRQYSAGQNQVWLMNGPAYSQGVALPSFDVNWTMASAH